MSIDFIIFLILIIFAVLYQVNNSKNIFIFYTILLIVFVIFMRINHKGPDFVQYYRYLHNVEGIRYIREFVYFSISLVLYKIVHNEIITFILMDGIWLYILLEIQKNINLKYNLKEYALVTILFTSFPLFFGYENIYRQLFAEIFSLYAYSIRDKNSFKSNIFFIIAIFMHNTALVILPFLIIKHFFNFNIKIRIFIATIISVLFDLLFGIAAHYKSGHETGLNMSIYYFMIFAILFYIYIIKIKFNVIGFIKNFPSVYVGIILMFGLETLPDGTISERMGMFFLIFVIYDLYIYSIRMPKKKQMLFRIGLLLVFSLPVIVFNSSRIML